MEPDTLKIWTRSEVHVSVGKMIVESLGVDEGKVTDDAALVRELVRRILDDLAATPLDLSGLTVEDLAGYLDGGLHAPGALDAVMNRFTVRAVGEYIVTQLARAGRLAPGA